MAFKNKSQVDQVQPPAPTATDQLERLTQQSAELESQIERLTEGLAPIEDLSIAMNRRQAIAAQLEVARHLAWQGRVNELMQRRITARNEWEQLQRQLAANSATDDEAKNQLWGPYAWDSDTRGATPEWVSGGIEAWLERRITLLSEIERHRLAHRQLSARISELGDVMKECDELLQSFHRLGDAALTATWHDLHPGYIAAGPDGVYTDGKFTPAAPPIPAPTAPAQKPVWRVETMLPTE